MRLSVVIPMIFVVLGVVIFTSGLHGVDTSWNMQRIGSNSDINYFGRIANSDTLYMQGIAMMFMGMCVSVFSALCVGLRKDGTS